MALYFYSLLAGFTSFFAPSILPVALAAYIFTIGRTMKRWQFFTLGFLPAFVFLGSQLLSHEALFGFERTVVRFCSGLILLTLALSMFLKHDAGVYWRQILGGFAFGIVWTPSAGAITGTIIEIGRSGAYPIPTFASFFAFGLGVSLVLAIISWLGTKLFHWLVIHRKKEFHKLTLWRGIALAVLGLLFLTGMDLALQHVLFPYFPLSAFTL